MGRGAISPDLVGLKSDIMKHVGLQGGSSIFELGAVSDMRCFFSIINSVGDRVPDLEVYMDRLYRRYLQLEDLDEKETNLFFLL